MIDCETRYVDVARDSVRIVDAKSFFRTPVYERYYAFIGVVAEKTEHTCRLVVYGPWNGLILEVALMKREHIRR